MIKDNFNFINIFEKRLAEYTGAKEAVVVNSCSSALFLSLRLLKILKKDIELNQVIPNGTYCSVPLAMIHAGFTPIIKDISWENYYQIGDLPLIDSAQYLTSGMCTETLKATKIKFCCVSFHEKKVLKLGTGGVILTNSTKCAKYLRRLSFDGRDYSKYMMDDDIKIAGYHMNMTPEQAAKGINLLNLLPEDIEPNGANQNSYKKLSDLTLFKEYYKEDNKL